jgi:hypothetical protein
MSVLYVEDGDIKSKNVAVMHKATEKKGRLMICEKMLLCDGKIYTFS